MGRSQRNGELYGKGTGTSQGLGGSMHIFSKEHRFYGGHGIVGGQIPLGAGMAFGDKYHGSDAVTLCCFGDGAARQGSLHETFNLAMIWKLPVIFICEKMVTHGNLCGANCKPPRCLETRSWLRNAKWSCRWNEPY